MDRHVESLQDELRGQVLPHAPADHPAAEAVQHHRQVEEAGPGRDVGDVRDPLAVGAGGTEVPLQQARRRGGGLLGTGGLDPSRRETPWMSALTIRRATRFFEQEIRCSSRSSARILGAP